MAQGGYRPGAGRKKGSKATHTLEAAAAKARIIELVSGQVEELIAPQIAKALNGDTAAFKEVMDRAYGKAPQALTGAEGGALQIVFDNALASSSEGDSK